MTVLLKSKLYIIVLVIFLFGCNIMGESTEIVEDVEEIDFPLIIESIHENFPIESIGKPEEWTLLQVQESYPKPASLSNRSFSDPPEIVSFSFGRPAPDNHYILDEIQAYENEHMLNTKTLYSITPSRISNTLDIHLNSHSESLVDFLKRETSLYPQSLYKSEKIDDLEILIFHFGGNENPHLYSWSDKNNQLFYLLTTFDSQYEEKLDINYVLSRIKEIMLFKAE